MTGKCKYQVLEDNGGGLHLHVWGPNGDYIYYSHGHQFDIDGLHDALRSLNDGGNPVGDNWEDNNLYDEDMLRTIRRKFDPETGHDYVDEDDIFDGGGNLIPLRYNEIEPDDDNNNPNSAKIILDSETGPNDNLGCIGRELIWGDANYVETIKGLDLGALGQAEITDEGSIWTENMSKINGSEYPIWSQQAIGWEGSRRMEYTIYWDFQDVYSENPEIEVDSLPWENERYITVVGPDDDTPFFG